MSHVNGSLPLWDKVTFFSSIPILLVKALISFPARLYHRRSLSLKWLKRSFISAIVSKAPGLPVPLIRWLMPTTGTSIAQVCAAEKLHHETVEVDAGTYPTARLHFINSDVDDDTRDIILYFHGGGFVYPISGGHIKLAQTVVAAYSGAVDLAILEYTLAPELRYPGQIAQCVAALKHLLQRRRPDQIILGGDSAGGNLVLAVLAHLRQPHPLIPAVVDGKIQPTLKAAFSISPVCADFFTNDSYRSNVAMDILSVKSMAFFVEHWAPRHGEVWATPIAGDKAFWGEIHAHRLLILAGQDEVLFDDIVQTAEKMGAEMGPDAKVQFKICPDEIHVQALIDLSIGVDDGVMLNTLTTWSRGLSQS